MTTWTDDIDLILNNIRINLSTLSQSAYYFIKSLIFLFIKHYIYNKCLMTQDISLRKKYMI